jgi:hypothetical protein
MSPSQRWQSFVVRRHARQRRECGRMFHYQFEVLARVVGRQFDELGRRRHIAEPPRIVEGGVHVDIDQFVGKQAADDRVERSLYQRANGYSHPAVKVFIKRDGTTVDYKYIEHYPPDPTSMCFWLKNRRPDRWRDVHNIDHAVGVYHISEAPMTEEDWIRETSNAQQLELEAAPVDASACYPLTNVTKKETND